MLTVLVLAGAVGCVPPADLGLVGLWESESRSKGGIGAALDFRGDGETFSAITVLVDGVYRVERGALFVAADPTALASEPNRLTFTVAGDVLTIADGEGGTMSKTRMGTPPKAGASIVGDWRYRHYAGGIAFERYTADGRLLFRLPMTSRRGCYSTADGTLETVTAESRVSASYKIDGDRLVVTATDGRKSVYRRSDRWYPLDEIAIRPPGPQVIHEPKRYPEAGSSKCPHAIVESVRFIARIRERLVRVSRDR